MTVGYSRLPLVNEWLQGVTAGHSRLPNGYNRLQQVTEWLEWVTAWLHQVN